MGAARELQGFSLRPIMRRLTADRLQSGLFRIVFQEKVVAIDRDQSTAGARTNKAFR